MSTPTATPPYALAPLTFRFAALATLSGRAPIGGQREVALATYVVARLAHDAVPDRMLPLAIREERANAARNWMASLTLPQTVRSPLIKLIDRSAADGGDASAAAVRGVLASASSYLNAASRAELTNLAEALESQAVAG